MGPPFLKIIFEFGTFTSNAECLVKEEFNMAPGLEIESGTSQLQS